MGYCSLTSEARDLISINLPKIGEEEVEAVVRVLRSGMLTSGLGAGANVREFEKNLCRVRRC